MTTDFNFSPYFDDFENVGGPKDSNYMRMLFKPSFAVQARELTQLQSILQNQIRQFGDHVFKDGSPVTGGQITLDTSVKSIKLNPQFGLEDVFVSDFLNKLIVDDTVTPTKKAIVVGADDSQQFPTLLVKYLTGTEFTNNDEIIVSDSLATRATLIAENSTDTGTVVSINEGIFYVDGFFVYVPEQTIVLDPYSRTPNSKVGLEIEEDIVDSSEDSTLLDPAQDSFNFQAPGADRYKFSLALTRRSLDSIDDSKFFELLRVENGTVTKQVKYPIYSELEKTLARRTFDESGNYTVVPFRASPKANTVDTVFDIEIEAGKAYVQGFEFETVGTTTLTADKARNTSSIQDYDLSLEFGNYLTVNNLFFGNTAKFNTSGYGSVDLHTVPSGVINTTNSNVYANTLAGTARVRSIQYAETNKYDMFLLDVNLGSIKTRTTAANAFSVTLGSNFSAEDNAYKHATIIVDDTKESRRVLNYNGSNKIVFVDRPFTVVPSATANVTLSFGVDNINSITIKPSTFAANVYATKNASTGFFACADVDFLSKTSEGKTFLQGSSLDRLIFPLPETYIVRDSIQNADYSHRKLTTQTINGSVNITLAGGPPAGETFYYGSDGSNLSSATIAQNILILVTNRKSSTASNGHIVIPSSVLRVSDTELQINVPITGEFDADVFVNVKIKDSEGAIRTKTVRGNTDIELPAFSGTAVTGEANVTIDTTNAVVWYRDSALQTTPGTKQPLYIPDVIRVVKVYDSGNTQAVPNNTNKIDITDRYILDTGQKDNYYDHASLILKNDSAPPLGQTAVKLMYYEHGGTNGYFIAASYAQEQYDTDQITTYSSKAVSSVSLRDCVDFRPTRKLGDAGFVIEGLKIPFTQIPMELSYGFYLGRIDRLIATPDREFRILRGVDAKFPQIPVDSQLGMPLYNIYIPPFTANVKDVKFEFIENRRYTMRDIGELEKRIVNVETLSILNSKEIEALRDLFLYEDGTTEKEKYGLVVDTFDGFNVADNKNPDLLCHISDNKLKPYKIFNYVDMEKQANTGPIRENQKTYSLDFVETRAVVQGAATKSVSVQPYLFASFEGELRLTPDIDNWISTELPPEVVSSDPIINQRPPTEVSAAPTVIQTPIQPTFTIPTFSSGGVFFGVNINSFGFEGTWVNGTSLPFITSARVANIVTTQSSPSNIFLGDIPEFSFRI